MEQNENENTSTAQDQDDQEDMENSSMKQWFRDNLRIIISVLIVVVIAGGIYSYSNRGTQLADRQEQKRPSDIINNLGEDQGSISDQETDKPDDKSVSEKPEEKKPQPAQPQQPATPDKTSSTATSQETEKSFVETSARGDSYTTLARRALRNDLEKNPDSSLTAEHKIYIEDYLRKHVPANTGRLQVGQSVEFSKDLIKEAIAKSKTLNESQLKNLQKYSARVSSLT